MQIIKEEKEKLFTLEAEEKQLIKGVQLKILRALGEREKYPKEVAIELKMHEQKVYYHTRQLEKNGFIKVARKEEKGGALAKLYELSSPAFFVRFSDFQETKRLPKAAAFEPFIRNGILNARIVVGSPDPHGPEKARSRDITFAVDLALFLGTFLNRVEPSVIEDKDAHAHDLQDNLILIGGPITNKVTKMVNEKLYVRFDNKRNIFSSKTKKTYKQDDCGFVAVSENPFNSNKKIVVIAGKKYNGTKAAVLSFIKKFDEMKKRNHMIVEGLDNDGDGEIDDVKVLE